MSQPHSRSNEATTSGTRNYIRDTLLLTPSLHIVRAVLNRGTTKSKNSIELSVTTTISLSMYHRFKVNVQESTLNIADVPFTIDDEAAKANLPNTYIRCKACGKIRALDHCASNASMDTILYKCEKCNLLVFIVDDKVYTSIDRIGRYIR